MPATTLDSTRPDRGRRRSTRPILAVLVAVLAVAATAFLAPTAASAQSDEVEVVITGRGWGHGRGMGQYGALGYARDSGWNSTQILDHYYGGTTLAPAPIPGRVDPTRVRVNLIAMRGHPTTVALADGTLHLMDPDGATLSRLTGAVRLTPVGGGLALETAAGCSGPWTAVETIAHPLVRIEAESAAAEAAGLLAACSPGRTVWYDGELWATSVEGTAHTINLVSIEQYLRGVIPNEVPASWPAAALEAQAVAARSYALAGDVRWPGYADTCDTTQCQVYDGRYTTRRGFRSATDSRTDAAVTATAGLVRLNGDGSVARTEFSSSTGGWTAGGDFPAVVDDGDSVADNPNHEWRVVVDLRSLESSYRRGRILGIGVIDRNGLGADGGRVGNVELRFETGSVTVTGDTLRRQLGLKSDWYAIGPLSRGGVVQEPIDRQLIGRFVYRAHQRLVGRAPTSAESETWTERIDQGSRHDLAVALVASEAYSGTLVDELYRSALGREPDAGGRSYWVATLSGGLKYEHLGTLFYSAPEYVAGSGGTSTSFVQALYRDVLGREADQAGLSYWVGLLADGRARPDDVANAFYRSLESRRDRARATHVRVLGPEPGSDTTDRLADRLLTIDDLALAAELAVDIDLEDP